MTAQPGLAQCEDKYKDSCTLMATVGAKGLMSVHMSVCLCMFCSTLEDCTAGNCLPFCKSLLSLLVWLLNVVLKSIENQVVSVATDKAIGLPIASIDGAFSYGSLIDRASDAIDKLTSSETLSALLHVALADNEGLST